MNLSILCTLAVLLPCSLLSAAEQITVDATFVVGKSARTLPHDLTVLQKRRGVDVVAAPRVVTRSGRRTQVAITREFHTRSVAPSKHPAVPTGVVLQVTPHSTRHGLTYSARLTIREFDSLTGPGVAPVSTFTTREVFASGTPKEGEEVWIDLPNRNGESGAVRFVLHRKDA